MNKKSIVAKEKPRNASGKFVKKYQQDQPGKPLTNGLMDYKTAANSSFIALPEINPPMPPNPAVTPVAPGVYHVNVYRSIATTPGSIYRNLDEALRASVQTAKAMLNDSGIMAPLFQRFMPISSFNDSVEPEDENDDKQVAICQEIMEDLKSIPRWTEFKRNLAVWTAWYGKHLNVMDWDFVYKNGNRKLTARGWFPIIGDKLIFRNNGRMGYLVHMPTGFRDVVYSDRGMAELFEAEDQDCLVHHKYFITDTTYDESMLAIGLEGFGYRHVVYWTYWLKQQLLEWALNAFQIFGAGGIRIGYFEQSNPESEAAVAEAMQASNGQNIILFPRPIGEENQGAGLEIVSPNGIDLSHFTHFIEDYFQKQINHLLLGYDFAEERHDLYDYQCYDAALLSETITKDLVSVFVKYNYPHIDFQPRYQINVPVPNTQEFLEAVQRAMECGLELKSSEVRNKLGFTMPTKKDKILVKPDGDAGIRKPKTDVHNLMDQLA